MSLLVTPWALYFPVTCLYLTLSLSPVSVSPCRLFLSHPVLCIFLSYPVSPCPLHLLPLSTVSISSCPLYLLSTVSPFPLHLPLSTVYLTLSTVSISPCPLHIPVNSLYLTLSFTSSYHPSYLYIFLPTSQHPSPSSQSFLPFLP